VVKAFVVRHACESASDNSGVAIHFKDRFLNRREDLALLGIDRVVQAYGQRAQRTTGFGGLSIRHRLKPGGLDGGHELPELAMTLTNTVQHVGRNVSMTVHPRQHLVVFGLQVMTEMIGSMNPQTSAAS